MVGAIVLILAFFGALQTDPGRATLVSLVEHFAAGPTFKLTIRRLDGFVPFDMTVHDATIADARGPWASIDRLHVAWAPSRLLQGVAAVETIDIGRLRVERRPLPSEPTNAAPPAPFSLPKLPVGVVIENLQAADLSLGAAVAGRPARLRIKARGSVVDPRQGLTADLEMARIDGIARQLSARAAYAPEKQRLAIEARAGEPNGGLVSSLLGVPSIAASLKGDGRLDRWHADLRFVGGKPDTSVQGTVSIADRNGTRVLEARLDAAIAALLPASSASLAAGHSIVAFSAVLEPDRSMTLRSLDIRAAPGRFTGTGRLDASGKFEAKLHGAITDAGAWSAAFTADRARWRDAAVDVAVDGTVARPAVTATLSAAGLAYGQDTVDHAIVHAQLRPTADLGDPAMRFAVEARADIERPVLPEARGFDFGQALTANLVANVDRSGSASIHTLRIDGAPLALSWRGAVGPQGAKGMLDVERAELSLLGPLLHRETASRLKTKVDLDVAFDLSRAAVEIDGSGDGLRSGDPTLDRVLSGPLSVHGGLARNPDSSIAFRKLTVTTPTLALTADGRATPCDAALDVNLAVVDLHRLDDRLNGRAEGSVEVSGRLDDLAAHARIGIAEGSALGRRIERLGADFDIKSLPGAPAGIMKLSGRVGDKATGQQVSGRGRVDLAVAGTLAAPRLSGTAGIEGGRFDDPINGIRLAGSPTCSSKCAARTSVSW